MPDDHGPTPTNGYSLDAPDTVLDPAAGRPFTFTVTGPDGAVVTGFTSSHQRELHFIVVSNDLATYAHLHPERAADGTWSVDLPSFAPGGYRAFADLAVADGPALTLTVDLAVPGEAVAAPLPRPTSTTDVDGYQVALAGAPVTGSASELALSVAQDGVPVTDLEPYLGAFGHLVAIRAEDLSYLHVHPLGEGPASDAERGGPTVQFALHVSQLGDYRLFFDFSHGGAVHTAGFTVEAPG